MFLANNLNKGGSLGGYQISRSLRFNSADSTTLNRTFSTNGTSRTTCTISFWTKLASMSTSQSRLIDCYDGSGADSSGIYYENNQFIVKFGGSGSTQVVTTAVYRDPSAWYHLCAVFDSTQATSTDRIKFYVNGVQVTSFSSASYPSQNATYAYMSSGVRNYIGDGWNAPATYLVNLYLAEFFYIDGQALTPSSFGETNAQTGVWQPKAYSGSYGTNGFYLNFSDNSNTTAATLGKDYSGNGNNWTPNGFLVSAGVNNDSLVDSPTSYGTDTGVGGTVRGNYATLNPVGLGGGTLTNGNLDLSTTVTTPAVGTMAMTTGKWYWEVTNNTVANPRIGVYNIGAANPDNLGATANGWCLLNAPSRTYNSGSAPLYGSYNPTTGTVVMVAYDADAGKLWFGQDGTWFASGNPATGANASMTSVTGSAIVPALANGAGTDTFSANFGQRPFAHTAPSGYKALCTQNLPTPTIGATSTTQANLYFNPVLYTGDRTDRTITVGFQPDWVWVKSRSAVDDHYLMNAVVGTGKYLNSNSTAAETTNANSLTAYTSTGFSVGNTGTTNETGRTYVAWNWKANGSGSTNTAGSITSTVSANTTSGFSVVNWTQPASGTYTIGHGLGVAPAMILMKSRTNTGNWAVYHQSIGYTQYGRLNTTDAFVADSSVWVAAPTSSVFSQIVNYGTGGTSIAYCFAEIAGYSKFGSYTGNGSSDGPFVYTGFRPAYVMVKVTTAANVWLILDATRNTSNVVTLNLNADQSSAENTYSGWCDFTSNGFKVRGTDGAINTGSGTYIYMAFASSPFKFSLAR